MSASGVKADIATLHAGSPRRRGRVVKCPLWDNFLWPKADTRPDHDLHLGVGVGDQRRRPDFTVEQHLVPRLDEAMVLLE